MDLAHERLRQVMSQAETSAFPAMDSTGETSGPPNVAGVDGRWFARSCNLCGCDFQLQLFQKSLQNEFDELRKEIREAAERPNFG